MIQLKVNSRQIIIFYFNEISQFSFSGSDFTILVETGENTNKIYPQLAEKTINNNCKEICFFGENADKYHDLFDEKIEDQELFNIVTTSLKNETEEEAIEYFINLSGSKPPVLYVYIDNNTFLRDLIVSRAQ